MRNDYWSVLDADLALSLATELKACIKLLCGFLGPRICKCGLFAGHSGDDAELLKSRARFGPLFRTLLISSKSCTRTLRLWYMTMIISQYKYSNTYRSWTLLYNVFLGKRRELHSKRGARFVRRDIDLMVSWNLARWGSSLPDDR